MKKQKLLYVLSLLILFTGCNMNSAKKEAKNPAILLVTFGSTYEAPQKTYGLIDQTVKHEFPESEVRWAYTSEFIIKRLHEGKGQGNLKGKEVDIDTPSIALEKMIKEGYSNVTVQSLHLIAGEEFDELSDMVAEVEKKHEGIHISLGRPLLDTDQDLQRMADALTKIFSREKESGDPLIFMGHGTPKHVNDKKYRELGEIFKNVAPDFYVGTVEGHVTIEDVLVDLDSTALSKNVTVTPLMSIAGNHANKDMNGVSGAKDKKDQSWRERLQAKGYKVTAIMKGLGDYPEIRALWLDHLKRSIGK